MARAKFGPPKPEIRLEGFERKEAAAVPEREREGAVVRFQECNSAQSTQSLWIRKPSANPRRFAEKMPALEKKIGKEIPGRCAS
jgi:hypothetical protein